MNQKGFSVLILLLGVLLLAGITGGAFYLGRASVTPAPNFDGGFYDEIDKTQSPSPSPSIAAVSLFNPPLKRLYFSGEKLIGEMLYPQEMLSIPEEDLQSLRCSPEYYADYDKGRYFYHEDPRAQGPEEMKDETLYNLAQKLYEDYSVLGDSFQACKVDNGSIILKYEKTGGGGGSNNIAGFVILNTDKKLEKITEIPNDGAPYFGCPQVLQLTKSNILWYKCGGGDGGFGSASVYKVDLNNKTHQRVTKCTSQSFPDTSSREPEVKCE